jgi:hypothetical protein
MQRLALSAALMSATLLAGAGAVALPGQAMAFEVNTGAATVPGGAAQFGDPDETPLPAPLPSARLEEDGTSVQMAPTGGSGNPADNGAMIPSPQGDMPFWTYSGAPAQRFR